MASTKTIFYVLFVWSLLAVAVPQSSGAAASVVTASQNASGSPLSSPTPQDPNLAPPQNSDTTSSGVAAAQSSSGTTLPSPAPQDPNIVAPSGSGSASNLVSSPGSPLSSPTPQAPDVTAPAAPTDSSTNASDKPVLFSVHAYPDGACADSSNIISTSPIVFDETGIAACQNLSHVAFGATFANLFLVSPVVITFYEQDGCKSDIGNEDSAGFISPPGTGPATGVGCIPVGNADGRLVLGSGAASFQAFQVFDLDLLVPISLPTASPQTVPASTPAAAATTTTAAPAAQTHEPGTADWCPANCAAACLLPDIIKSCTCCEPGLIQCGS